MKIQALLLVIMMTMCIHYSCTGQSDRNSEKETVSQASDIEVYYFHYTRRCVTCLEVESVSAEAVNELFGDSIPFKSHNMDEPEGKEMAQKLGIAGQTLLIANGDKKINITNEGFMYARGNPEKLKQIISDHIISML